MELEHTNFMENISLDAKIRNNNIISLIPHKKTTNLSTDRLKEVFHICLSQLQV